jgi:alanyl-tRNA synthetase
MTSDEIRKKYLEFFKEQGHAIVPSASLVPENDPTTLFTGSGMQPMVPYLLGQTHPQGVRIADSQKSFRTSDIEEVGDNRHTTFFEMLGNWSFGDYFKEQQLPWIFKFLTEELQLDPNKIYVTVFSGDKENGLSSDIEAVKIWKELFKEKGIDARNVDFGTEEQGASLGMQGGRIFGYSAKNWWSRAGAPEKMPIGEPGGPDSEIFYEFNFVQHDPKFGEKCHPNCDCGRYIEIGNSVFMQFVKVADKKFELLPNKNIDFGGGLERISMAVQNTNDIFKIDIFKTFIESLEKISGTNYTDPKYTVAYRVIADHLRASVFLIGDGVNPSNTDQGYFVRRLLRRAVRYADILGIKEGNFADLVDYILEYYKNAYPETYAKKEVIKSEIQKEEEKFRKTLRDGIKQLEYIASRIEDGGNIIDDIKRKKLSGLEAFNLYQSYGFPIEITIEICKEKNIDVDLEAFQQEMKKHQDLSRIGAEKKFKGGLGDTSDKSVQYHTATHLLNAALRQVLGDHVMQKGSNITPERLRFDFSHGEKMTDEQKKKVEDLINGWIEEKLPVEFKELPKSEAEKIALHSFAEKYGDVVKVYSVGTENKYVSQEFCGGPHVKNTGDLQHFKIQKEEAVSAGVRRIKAILG